ncbi:hypothetical protein DH2020_024030 [Rehmannia glutinosa]|uniref:TATA-box-binding protein n=1 Tax=Rehmannia glutinosa TaxID=99300 RepID=A0ABR0WBK1_REHGL
MDIDHWSEVNHLPENFQNLFPNAEFSDNIKPSPIIQNIVSTVNLDCKLNLQSIASKALNAEYNPNRFSAVIMRIKEPKTTALIFKSGKVVCTGAKTEEASKIAARKFARIVQKLGFPVNFVNFRIQNIVASCDVRFVIRLESMAATCSDEEHSAVYEPELFPGLIYRTNNSKVVILVFASGKIVIAGAKVEEDIFTAFHKIYPILQQYKRAQQ